MISLEQWRAAIGGWNAGKLSAIYRRYGSRRIVRNWAKLLLVMDSYTAVIYYALYWLIAGLFAFISMDGWVIALSVVFDDACGYPHDIRRALVESPTATVLRVSHDYLQRFWVFASPTVTPLLRSCMIRLQRLWKLASPSVSSMLRLLLALNWLLIVAGDVELNPGPVPHEIQELLSKVDASELCEGDIFDVLEEVMSLAGRWPSICFALRLLPSDKDTIARSCRDIPGDCLREVLSKWLQRCYDTKRHGPPTWQMLVAAVANSAGGDNPSLAKQIAENHQGTTQTASLTYTPQAATLSTDPSSTVVSLYAQYLRGRYRTQIPTFLTLQWPPPPTRKIFNLAMIQGQNIPRGPIDEEIVRLTLRGQINDIIYPKTPVELKDILKKDKAERKVILIEGAPGAGKSTLAWHVCQTWESGELFQNFRSVVYVQLRDPTIQSAQSVEDIIPAQSKDQAEKVMAEFRTCSGRDLLLVLDGWDELPSDLHTKSIFQQLIALPETLNLHFSTAIITSRPIASSDLYHFISSRIEILGFTPSEVKDYFTDALRGESQAVQKLQDQLKECPMVEASCYLPLNAAIVTHLFLVQNYSLPTTLHGVFTMVVLCCLKRHIVKQKQEREKQITTLDNLPEDIKPLFKAVYTLAYHGVMDNRATFPLDYLESHGLPKISETLGLIQGVESFTLLDSSPSYHFLHLSVQELLAAFYISKLPGNEQVVAFNKLFGEPRFAAVFRFYAAFTKLETEGIQEVVADIIQKKDKHQMLYLLHGLYEAQTLSLCQYVGSQLGGVLDLSDTALSPVDCLAVGYFISCICLTGSGAFNAALNNCLLDSYRVSYLTKELSKCTRSASMHKPKVAVTDAGVSSCLELILDLLDNEVGDEGVTLLCGGNVIHLLKILSPPTQTLSRSRGEKVWAADLSTSLEGNDISDEGGRVIAEGLKVNRSLTTLYLTSNGLSDSAISAIGEALKVNQSLRALHLVENNISDAGGRAIAEALKVNHSLTTLDLSANQISDDGGRAIAEALKVNHSLTKLSLQFNQISDEGARAFAAALRVNKSLTKLGLWGNISTEMESLLFKEFSERVTV